MTTPFYHKKSVTPSNTSDPPTIEGTFTHDSIPPDVDMLDDESKDLDKWGNIGIVVKYMHVVRKKMEPPICLII